jgi:predicted nucleotidyltransferase
MTRFGPLDILGTVATVYTYDDLLPHTVELMVDDIKIRMLDLPTLIKIKEETGREQDQVVLPILKRTLEEKMKG